MTDTRTRRAARNFFFATIGNIVSYIAAFILQTLFIRYLGLEYNGVRGLFSNILGTLSLAELGISSAVTFALYEPLAKDDRNKIRAIICFYRKAYRYVALVISVIGLSVIPLLKYMIHGDENIRHIILIYILYLADSALSYLIIYKSVLLEADQKSYLFTRIYTVFNLISLAAQSFILIVFKDFILFLVLQIVIGLASKICVNIYTGKVYPFLNDSNNHIGVSAENELDEQEKSIIMRKIKALFVHKIGDVAVNQTDNIIMSSMINLTTVGICSNFTMIIRIISTMITSFFVSASPGLGNVVATETMDVKKDTFSKYDFLCFILYGWSAICLYFLLIPFVTLWIGADKLIDGLTLFLICINYYFTGRRISLSNIKTAAGIFEQGAWLSIVESVINLVLSVIGVRLFGLPGIFMGTLISSMIQNICQPCIVYKYIFSSSASRYFKDYFCQLVYVALCGISIFIISGFLCDFLEVSKMIFVLLIRFALCLILPLLIMILLFGRTSEFIYVKDIIIGATKKAVKKLFGGFRR